MGITTSLSSSSSSNESQDRDIYFQLINASKTSGGQTANRISASSSVISSIPSSNVNPKIAICHKSRILRRLNYLDIWEVFLQSQFMTFALTPAEVQEVLRKITTQSITAQSEVNASKDKCLLDSIELEIKEYLEIIQEINEKDGIKSIDIMAIISSVLLLNPIPIEVKIDQLFQFIQLNPLVHDFNGEDFLVALSSFERGISFAVGKKTCSEAMMKEVATQWITLADPLHRTMSTAQTIDNNNSVLINQNAFFEFCTNRQHIVRRLLEGLAVLEIVDNKSTVLQEVTDTLEQLKPPAGGGDEWMANPAWRKTAEKMIPPDVKAKYQDIKPSSNLSIDWIHGYRGFDCRNNVHYLGNDKISFTAAAVSVVQDNSFTNDISTTSWKNRKQSYFCEHGDDIVAIAVFSDESHGRTLVASGEIGKMPAVYLYAWHPPLKRNDSGFYESLGCLKGSHQKGIAQLAFANDGKYLYTVGIEYSVAIYCIDTGNLKQFGKLVASGQGPKDRILHISTANTGDYKFYTSGEKHIILWTFDNHGILKQDNCKLGTNKNKMFLSIAKGATTVLTTTSEGDIFSMQDTSLSILTVNKGQCEGHSKSAINALAIRTIQGKDFAVTGDKDGKVVLWRLAAETPAISLSILMEFTVTVKHAGLLKSIDGLSAISPGKNSSNSVSNNRAIPIRALDITSDGGKILVGTQSCEIIEYSLSSPPQPFTALTKNVVMTVPETMNAKLLVTGHFQGEVWGLSRRPITEQNFVEGTQFCTVGDDGYLRIWNVDHHQPVGYAYLGGIARAVDYSPDGLYVAIGFGGRLGNKKGKNPEDGLVKVLRIDHEKNSSLPQPFPSIKLTQVAEVKEAKQWISVIRFSPDGTTLAVGSRDNSIYLYSVPNQYRRKAKFAKHSAGINQIDFSADSKFIQSCCSGYEILFSDSSNGVQIGDGASKFIGEEWATWTLTLGWPVIGIWSGSMDGTDVNNVDRSPTGKLLATCDDFGKVNLFNWPSIRDKGSQHSSFSGHSSFVTNLKWISVISSAVENSRTFSAPRADDYLISVGGADKCVFQWKHSGGGVSNSSTESKSTSEREPSEVEKEGADINLPTGGDEFMAVKPWLGAIVCPTAWLHPDHNKIASFYASLSEFSNRFRQLNDLKEVPMPTTSSSILSRAPSIYQDLNSAAENVMMRLYESGINEPSSPTSDELELEFVYGYRGFDCRNNLFYVTLPNQKRGERFVLYYAAALGILYNPQSKQQSYFRGHNDDILSMAVSEIRQNNQIEQVLVATGQQGTGNGIFVWEIPSMQTLSVIKTKQKTVLFLQFSSNGRTLISIGEDKSLTVVEWKSQTILASTKMDGNTIFDVALLHPAKDDSSSSIQFFTAGDKLLKLWTIDGRNINSSKYTTNATVKEAKLQPFLTVQELFGKFLVGCEDGNIYIIPRDAKGVKGIYSHTNAVRSFREHSTDKENNEAEKAGKKGMISVTAMTVWRPSNGMTYLISGGKDGSIVLWNATTLSLTDQIEPAASFLLDDIVMPDGLPFLAKQIQSIFAFPESFQSVPPRQVQDNNSEKVLLLIGTRGCDVLEVEWDFKASIVHIYQDVIVRSHFSEELWGLASHPFLPEIATVGDDKTLRLYHLHARRCIALVSLGFFARCCCYNSEGNLLAVGFGGRVGKGKEQGDGIVRLYSISYGPGDRNSPALSREINKVAERHDAKQWVSDIKFSADQKTVVAGAHDCKIYIYNVAITGKSSYELSLRSVFAKHNAVINHLDLSADGRFLQSNCAGYEILFSDLTTGKQITNPNEVKDVKWNTWTCTLGWPVQGIWESEMKGSDINGVCRSHTGHLLATSDDFGRVHLFRYPVLPPPAAPTASSKTVKKSGESTAAIRNGSSSFCGHSSHVMNVRWSAGDEYLLSVGGNDKCIFQWRHVMSDVTPTSGSSASGKSEKKVTIVSAAHSAGVVESSDQVSDLDAPESITPSHGKSSAEDLLSVELEGGGDESMAVKPWVGAVRPPKNPPPINPQPPTIEIALSWIHGYSSTGISHHQNLFYNLNGSVIYPTASLAIALQRPSASPIDWKQSYFKGHDDDVLCLTMSNNRRFIATGQIASKRLKGKASVMVWDAIQFRLLSNMEGCHSRGVAAVAFNSEGNQLISVGLDDNCTHLLWNDAGGNWSRVQQIASVKGDRQATTFIQFLSPQHPMVLQNEYHFITGNQKTLNLWKIEGSNLSKKAAKIGKKCPSNCQFFSMAQIFSSASNNNTTPSPNSHSLQSIIGNSNGDLLVLEGRELSIGVEKAHREAVFALAIDDYSSLLISGGKDGMIHLWNTSLQVIHSYSLTSLYSSSQFSIPLFDSSIISLNIKLATESRLSCLVGTAGGDILEITISGVNSDATNSSVADKARSYDFDKASLGAVVYAHCRGELWGLATHPLDADIYATVGDDSILRIWSVKRNCCLNAKKLSRPARSITWHPLGTILAIGLVSPEELQRKAGKSSGKPKKAAKGKALNDAKAEGKDLDDPLMLSGTDDNELNSTNAESSIPDHAMLLIYAFQTSVSPPSKSPPVNGFDLRYVACGGLPYNTSDPSINIDGSKGKSITGPSIPIASINDIKFTPNGRYLIIGGHDSKVHGYSLPSVQCGNILQYTQWNEWGKCLSVPTFIFNKHSSSILHFDCSNDSSYLQSNDIGNELLFYDLTKFKQEPSASKLADYNNYHISAAEDDGGADGGSKLWASQTCVFGWSVQGIWPATAYDSSEINSIDRHVSMKLLATGEDSGNVRILRYPAVIPNSQSIELTGHSSHVTNVRWTIANYLVSVGGNDKSVFVWQYHEK